MSSAATTRGERVTAALTAAFACLGPALEHGWLRHEGGFVAGLTGAPAAAMNGVFGAGPDADPALVDALLDEIAASGVPHCLEIRPGSQRLEQLAARRGMTLTQDVPLMELVDLDAVGTRPEPEGLSWHPVATGELDGYVRLVAEGFGAPEELFACLVTPRTLALPGLYCVVGRVGGKAVTTAMAITIGEATGIFNVATPEDFRRRGYASAATAQCVRVGRDAGARWAFLQASAQGFAAYGRLGFETVERWMTFVSPGS
jgi:hypothetical protein